jgi:hypothetical protein
MSITIRFALAAAIVLSSVAAAGAAPKRQTVPRAQATVPRAAPFSNPDSPAATGGGNLGYNQNIYNW